MDSAREKWQDRSVKVREALQHLEKEGWILSRKKGSHRQFVHPMKPGMRVTVSGNTGTGHSQGNTQEYP
jgi:predicted RNA binding protein YcfA (HicA-like mRNA interferase family)